MLKLPPIVFVMRHWKTCLTIGMVAGASIGAGYKAISTAHAQTESTSALTSADVSGLRGDIGDLRKDLRDERKSREGITTQIVDIVSRLGKLEGAASGKAK